MAKNDMRKQKKPVTTEDSDFEIEETIEDELSESLESFLQNLVTETEDEIEEKAEKMPMKTDTEDLDGDGKTDDKIPAFVTKKQKKSKSTDNEKDGDQDGDKDLSKVPPQLRKHVAKKKKKKVDEGAPAQISKSSIRQHSKDLAKNYGDAETASLVLRGASREQLMGALQDLLSSGDISAGQLKAAVDKMDDVAAKFGTMEEGGAAQRQGNEDRLRRQEPDRIKEQNELLDIKKSQSSINKLNETRLLNINKALMERLVK